MHEFFGSKKYILFVVTLGVFIDTFSYSIVIPFLPKVILAIGGDAKDTGIVLSFFSLGLLVGSLVFGMISDRFKARREIMVGSLIVLLASSFVMAFTKTLYTFGIARFFQGLASGSIWVVGLSLVADTHTPAEMGISMGTIFTAYTLGNFIGPICGGVMFEKLGYIAPFMLVVALCVVDGVFRFMIDEPKNSVDIIKTSIKTTCRILFSNTGLMQMCALSTLAGMIIGSLELNIALILQNKYGLSPGLIGLAYLAFVIPELIAGPISGLLYDRRGFKFVTIPTMLLAAALFIGLGIANSLFVFIAILSLLAFVIMLAMTPIMPEICNCVPENFYGSSYGLFNCAFAIGLLAGPLIGSSLYQFVGWLPYCGTMAFLLILSASCAFLYKPQQSPKLEKASSSMSQRTIKSSA